LLCSRARRPSSAHRRCSATYDSCLVTMGSNLLACQIFHHQDGLISLQTNSLCLSNCGQTAVTNIRSAHSCS
jgi:hypothetical protein